MPQTPEGEVIETLVSNEKLRIQRILSNEISTPSGEWYDQKQDEWVIVLKGSGTLAFEDGSEVALGIGDHLLIPKRKKHRVARASPQTIWLAVHFS